MASPWLPLCPSISNCSPWSSMALGRFSLSRCLVLSDHWRPWIIIIIIIIINIIYSWCNLVQGTNSFQLKNRLLNNIIHVLLINIQKMDFHNVLSFAALIMSISLIFIQRLKLEIKVSLCRPLALFPSVFPSKLLGSVIYYFNRSSLLICHACCLVLG